MSSPSKSPLGPFVFLFLLVLLQLRLMPPAEAALFDAAWRDRQQATIRLSYRDPKAQLAQAQRDYAAAKAVGDVPGQARAAAAWSSAAANLGGEGIDAAKGVLLSTLEAARSAQDIESQFDVLEQLVAASLLMSDVPGAKRHAADLHAIVDKSGNPVGYAYLHFHLGNINLVTGNASQAIEEFSRGLGQDPPAEVRALLLAAMGQTASVTTGQSKGAIQDAIANLEAANQILPPETYPYFGVQTRAVVAQLRHAASPDRSLLEQYEGVLVLAERTGSQQWRNWTHHHMAKLHISLGEPEQAIKHMSAFQPDPSDLIGLFEGWLNWAEALSQKHDPASLAYLSRAETKLAVLQAPRFRNSYNVTRARVMANLEDFAGAYRSMKLALDSYEQQAAAANEQLRQELQVRFNVKTREQENALLKAREQASEERRRLQAIGLGVSAVLLGALAFMFLSQLRQKRRLAEVSAQLQESNRTLNELHTMRSSLLAAACHDLRQPAHSLGMLAELAELEPDEKGRRDKLASIKRCSTTLSDMLGMLMDLTQLEGNYYMPSFSDIELDELVGELESQYRPAAERKGLKLVTHKSGLRVHSDRHLLRRIVFNIVSNAVKYTPRGAIEVRMERKGNEVQVSVRDTGPGIPADKQADVFMEHYRLARDAGVAEGFGIGLPVVKRAADLLGIALTLESSAGRGTCMSLVLPLAAEAGGLAAEPADAGVLGAGKLVAVVEDDTDARQAMVNLLRRWGFGVVAGPNYEGLMRAAASDGQRRKPDLVITDMHLLDDNGLSAVAALRAHWQDDKLPALMITGDVNTRVAALAEQVHVEIAHKPLLPARLRSKVAEALAIA